MFLSDSRRARGSDVSSQSCISMIAAEMFSFSINRKASSDRRERACHSAASFFDDVLDFEGDQGFIFDDKDTML